MKLTRRQFLALTGSVGLLSLDLRTRPSEQTLLGQECLILDLKKHCSLPESFQGYRGCLTDLGFSPVIATMETLPRLLPQARQVVVPAAGSMDAALAGQLRGFLEHGGSVLLESGLAFVDPVVWDAQRTLLLSHFGILVQPPAFLWSSGETHRGDPYVDFLWPSATKIRDFSRAVPVFAQRGEVIAQVGGMTVGVRRRVGGGVMTILGSPLGPLLRAGDQEGKRWLGAALCLAKV